MSFDHIHKQLECICEQLVQVNKMLINALYHTVRIYSYFIVIIKYNYRYIIVLFKLFKHLADVLTVDKHINNQLRACEMISLCLKVEGYLTHTVHV